LSPYILFLSDKKKEYFNLILEVRQWHCGGKENLKKLPDFLTKPLPPSSNPKVNVSINQSIAIYYQLMIKVVKI
jgi:hypothetical protein